MADTLPSTIHRRHLLGLLSAGTAVTMLPRIGFAAAPTEKRFIFFILRGGMDGLAAVMPVGDPGFAKLRDDFAANQRAVPLDSFFALHAELGPLKPYYDAGDLLPVQAVASSHRGRSHFEAQDVLEAGIDKPNSQTAGWVNRMLGEYQRNGHGDGLGLAVGPMVPLALRGPVAVSSIAPDNLPEVPASFIERMTMLWGHDRQLGPALASASAGIAEMEHGMPKGGGLLQATVELARLTAARLAQPRGPRIAVFDLNGFDTHSGEANRLEQQFKILAAALTTMAEGLRPVWADTAILTVSEFGRTAAPNGSGGTDHGTAGAALLLGGAVKGGRVLTDWPGLRSDQLFEGRDLTPTLHVASLYKGIAAGLLGLDGRDQMARLFPDNANSRPADIIRA